MTLPDLADPRRRKAFRRGRVAEFLCLWLLRLKGYRILAHDWRTPVGEVDLIARRGRTLVAVEVKARPSATEAIEAVSPRQRRRVERALLAFVAARPRLADADLRFDVMLVVPGRLPRHMKDAWRAGD